MKKSTITWLVVLAAVLILLFSCFGAYNKMVGTDEQVKAQGGNIENQYKRRADLIPNLVSTVKGYTTHEQQTLTEVVQARARATQMTLDVSSAQDMATYDRAQGDITRALGRLMAITENYPDLKANQNFLDLQTELSGTENRIAVERRKYNEVAQQYNTLIRRFPNSIVASITGFEKAPYFETDETSREVPKVEF